MTLHAGIFRKNIGIKKSRVLLLVFVKVGITIVIAHIDPIDLSIKLSHTFVLQI